MTPTETRDTSYAEIAQTLPARQQAVYNVIQIRPMTNGQICRWLNLPINCITGRVKELRDKGLVEQAGTTVDMITGRTVARWRVRREPQGSLGL